MVRVFPSVFSGRKSFADNLHEHVQYRRMLAFFDLIFGSFWTASVVMVAHLWYRSLAPGAGLASIVAFFLSNALISETAKRVSGPRRVQLERFRYGVVGPLLAMALVITLPAPLAPFWYGFLTLAISEAPVMLSHRSRSMAGGLVYGAYLMVLYGVSLWIKGGPYSEGAFVDLCTKGSAILIVTLTVSYAMARLTELFVELSQREQHLREVQEIARVGDYRLHLATNEMHWSEGCYRILGEWPDEAGPSFERFVEAIHPDDRAAFRESFAKTRELGNDSELEFRLRSNSGGLPRYVRCVRHVIRAEEGGPITHVKGILQDMTDAHRLQESKRAAEDLVERQRAQVVAASRMSALGEMASGVAHEINNPLAIITGKTQQLLRVATEGELDRELAVRGLEKIDATAKRIAAIVRGLRTFARDGQQDPFEGATVDAILEDTLSLCRSRFAHHGVELRVAPAPADVTLECRPVQVAQILLNLLNNSFDAVEALPTRWVQLEVEADETWIRFLVTDSGAGIPAAVREKIGQPFFTTKPVGKGTGLGLSIISGILNDHRGKLEINAESPHTQFIAWLPRHQAHVLSRKAG